MFTVCRREVSMSVSVMQRVKQRGDRTDISVDYERVEFYRIDDGGARELRAVSVSDDNLGLVSHIELRLNTCT